MTVFKPHDWVYGDWENIELRPIEVPIIILKCNTCNELYRVYPSFVVKGTTLTLKALAFIAFVYEFSELTWRDIPDKFCDNNDKIAHSTLYKAVYGLGKGMLDDKAVQGKINELNDKYLNISQDTSFRYKSRFEHTQKREYIIRKILKPLLMDKLDCKIIRLFYIFLNRFKQILSNMDPPVKKLYANNINIIAIKAI